MTIILIMGLGVVVVLYVLILTYLDEIIKQELFWELYAPSCVKCNVLADLGAIFYLRIMFP